MSRQEPCRYFAKYKAIYEPKCHCSPCWDKYFMTQVGKFQAAFVALEKLNRAVVVKVKGDKFVKQLERFLNQYDEPTKQRKQLEQSNKT